MLGATLSLPRASWPEQTAEGRDLHKLGSRSTWLLFVFWRLRWGASWRHTPRAPISSPALPPTRSPGPGDAGSSLRSATCPQNTVPYSWASWLVHRQGYRWVLRGRGNGEHVGNRRVLASSEPRTTSGDRQPPVLLWRKLRLGRSAEAQIAVYLPAPGVRQGGLSRGELQHPRLPRELRKGEGVLNPVPNPVGTPRPSPG